LEAFANHFGLRRVLIGLLMPPYMVRLRIDIIPANRAGHVIGLPPKMRFDRRIAKEDSKKQTDGGWFFFYRSGRSQTVPADSDDTFAFLLGWRADFG